MGPWAVPRSAIIGQHAALFPANLRSSDSTTAPGKGSARGRRSSAGSDAKSVRTVPCWLAVDGQQGIAVRHRAPPFETIVAFPMHHVRRYGQDDNTVTLEVGAEMNAAAAGVYSLVVEHGAPVFSFLARASRGYV